MLSAVLFGCSEKGGQQNTSENTDFPSEDSYFSKIADEFFNFDKVSRLSPFPHTGMEWHTDVTHLEGNEQVAAVGKYLSEEAVFYIIATSEERHYEFLGLLWDKRESRFTQVIPLKYDYQDDDKHSVLGSVLQIDSLGKMPNIIQSELEDAEIVGRDSTGYSASGNKTFWHFDGTMYVSRPFNY